MIILGCLVLPLSLCKSGHRVTQLPPLGPVTGIPPLTPLRLTHLDANDNTNYMWSYAAIECNACHGNQLLSNPQTGASYDEMNEWFRSGHAKVFNGGYFKSMYKGTSRTGKPSIPAQPVIIGNEWVPVPPEKSDQYHGPGFQLDFPGQSGNCAYCHIPASISISQESTNLTSLFPKPEGAWGEGVTCDVCHKVFNVILADDKFPFPDRPGILSYRFLRPNSGIFITGPFSNILTKQGDGSTVTVNHSSTCAPIFSQSEFCARHVTLENLEIWWSTTRTGNGRQAPLQPTRRIRAIVHARIAICLIWM